MCFANALVGFSITVKATYTAVYSVQFESVDMASALEII